MFGSCLTESPGMPPSQRVRGRIYKRCRWPTILPCAWMQLYNQATTNRSQPLVGPGNRLAWCQRYIWSIQDWEEIWSVLEPLSIDPLQRPTQLGSQPYLCKLGSQSQILGAICFKPGGTLSPQRFRQLNRCYYYYKIRLLIHLFWSFRRIPESQTLFACEWIHPTTWTVSVYSRHILEEVWKWVNQCNEDLMIIWDNLYYLEATRKVLWRDFSPGLWNVLCSLLLSFIYFTFNTISVQKV